MTLTLDQFTAFHQAVHGYEPFDWQSRLLKEIVEKKKWPEVLDLPTGSGKTTCIDIALFALALDAQEKDPTKRWCPRRIAMVVDRRVVVDQVAERGRKILRALNDSTDAVVKNVNASLSSLSNEDDALGVYTLRGGMPKDDGWARTPDQPLILASTVDQIGSRMLIQGYGVSRGMKPVHAGLLTNDTLLLLDEVHLSRPFAETLNSLAALRARPKPDVPYFSTRFHSAFLSATPMENKTEPFRLTESETAPGSRLSGRLRASKAATIEEVTGRPALESMCVRRAIDLIKKHDVVAVVVNRVASASTIVRALREQSGGIAEIKLLTGRMRPLDRDDLLKELRPRIVTGRARTNVAKLIVVGTQCIEAGADFDFDALVTESASLDALQQRFGRVDRLGEYGCAEGAIIHDKEEKDDPVYGEAIAATVKWLKAHLTKKTIDFGILALPSRTEDEKKELAAPAKHAPVMLPAYLDLWMQTSPAPSAVPEVALWLHGPDSGPEDVQVVWRSDLSESDLKAAYDFREEDDEARERPTNIVAAIRPSSLEAISLPFTAARRWLRSQTGADPSSDGDVGPSRANPDDKFDDKPHVTGEFALRWNGDDSRVISASELKPGNTIIVPSTRGGLGDGCFDGSSKAAVPDLAERAALLARGVPALRLHPEILEQWNIELPTDAENADVKEALNDAAGKLEPHSWLQVMLEEVAKGRSSVAITGETSWAVWEGRKMSAHKLRKKLRTDDSLEAGAELTTDEDDSFQEGKPVLLSKHSSDVEAFASVYAAAAGLPPEIANDLALAGWLHDIGKVDPRFQLLLRGGGTAVFFKDDRDEQPWAKSGMVAGARAERRRAQRKSGYPQGARHEVQSVAMLHEHLDSVKANATDPDLVLHLVASHHGYCRPFAPAVEDWHPESTGSIRHMSSKYGEIAFSATSTDHQLHRLDSPIADRFWLLVEKYGCLELCWFESILRLADHRASEQEQEEELHE